MSSCRLTGLGRFTSNQADWPEETFLPAFTSYSPGQKSVQPAAGGCILCIQGQREAETMKETLGKALRLGLLATLACGTALAQSPPPAPDPAKAQPQSEKPQAAQNNPVQQQDTVNPKNSKEDVDAI